MKGKNVAQIAEDMERERQVKLAQRRGSGRGLWKVMKNPCGGYIVARVKDVSKTVHGGNLEYYGDYGENKAEKQAIADKLNKEEAAGGGAGGNSVKTLCCPLCRAEVRENAASCPRCGRRLKG